MNWFFMMVTIFSIERVLFCDLMPVSVVFLINIVVFVLVVWVGLVLHVLDVLVLFMMHLLWEKFVMSGSGVFCEEVVLELGLLLSNWILSINVSSMCFVITMLFHSCYHFLVMMIMLFVL